MDSYRIYIKKRLVASIIDETVIQIANHYKWLWITIGFANKAVQRIYVYEVKHVCIKEFPHH